MRCVARVLTAVTVLLLGGCGADATHARETTRTRTVRVLFVGNSYTYENDLPAMVTRLGRSTPRPVHIVAESVTWGGKDLRWHWEQGPALERIEEGRWDHVVIQGHSLEPLTSPDDFRRYATRLVRAARRSGARPLLYMTWARADGDPIYTVPEVGRDPVEMQARLARAYEIVGGSTGAGVAPVGLAWYRARAARPGIRLHRPDRSHPSVAGTYLAACVIHDEITAPGSEPPRHQPRGLGHHEAALLREIAGHAHWRAGRLGALPIPR